MHFFGGKNKRIAWGLAFLFGICAAPKAWALRVANFVATGQCTANTGGAGSPRVTGSTQAGCLISVVNASSNSQTITFTFSGKVNGAALPQMGDPQLTTTTINITQSGSSTSPYTASSSYTDTARTLAASGTAGDSVTYEWLPPPFGASFAVVDYELRCEGSIQVWDTTATSPGFVTASGVITTFTQSASGAGLGVGGGDSNTAATNPTSTPIVIGEGRAF